MDTSARTAFRLIDCEYRYPAAETAGKVYLILEINRIRLAGLACLINFLGKVATRLGFWCQGT